MKKKLSVQIIISIFLTLDTIKLKFNGDSTRVRHVNSNLRNLTIIQK